MHVLTLYKELLKKHGLQGWWPINGQYHPGDYTVPRNEKEQFEICAGAILTQHTAWRNVERALVNLRNHFSPKWFVDMPETHLAAAIRPAGHPAQKATCLRTFARFYLALEGDVPRREALLSIKGIGPETADSILCYGYKQPLFIVDTYARRLLSQHGIVPERATYHAIQAAIHTAVEPTTELMQELHALIVAEGKVFYKRAPVSQQR